MDLLIDDHGLVLDGFIPRPPGVCVCVYARARRGGGVGKKDGQEDGESTFVIMIFFSGKKTGPAHIYPLPLTSISSVCFSVGGQNNNKKDSRVPIFMTTTCSAV